MLAKSPYLSYFWLMEKELESRIKKLQNALSVGAPLKIALKHAGIKYAEFLYWNSLVAVVDYCKEQEAISKLSTKKALAESRKRASETAFIEDRGIEPETELIALYMNSASFKKEANEIKELMDKCETAKTNSILRHLTRISTSNDRNEISASQWFLERALPTAFGKAEEEEKKGVAPIKVQFVSSKSEQSIKRLEDMEREVLGEGKRA